MISPGLKFAALALLTITIAEVHQLASLIAHGGYGIPVIIAILLSPLFLSRYLD